MDTDSCIYCGTDCPRTLERLADIVADLTRRGIAINARLQGGEWCLYIVGTLPR